MQGMTILSLLKRRVFGAVREKQTDWERTTSRIAEDRSGGPVCYSNTLILRTARKCAKRNGDAGFRAQFIRALRSVIAPIPVCTKYSRAPSSIP